MLLMVEKGIKGVICYTIHTYATANNKYTEADLQLLCNFIEVALRHECSLVNLLYIFKTPFPKNTSGCF